MSCKFSCVLGIHHRLISHSSKCFSTTATLRHVTPLPSDTTFESAIKHLQNHDLLIKLDPEFANYEALPHDESAPNTRRYQVTDHMHTLPKGLWDTTVKFECQITNTDDGLEWVIKAPLGLMQRTTWKLARTNDFDKGMDEAEDEEERTEGPYRKNEWMLVEDVEIQASRLLVGTVKGKCEKNCRGIHGRFVGHLQSIKVMA